MATFKTIKNSEFIKSSPSKRLKLQKNQKINKRKTMSFTLPDDVYDFLIEMSEMGMNRSKIVERALREYMDKA